jgi:hypothetical protein
MVMKALVSVSYSGTEGLLAPPLVGILLLELVSTHINRTFHSG